MKINEQLIEPIIKGVILEYGGISDEIMKMSELIFNKIQEQHRDYQRQMARNLPSYNNHPLYIKRFNLYYEDSSELMNIASEIIVNLYFYDSNSEDYSDFTNFLNEEGLIKLHYSVSRKMICLTFAWPNDDRMTNEAKNNILSSINHEVKHAYQGARRKNDFVSDQYAKAAQERDKAIGYYKEADTALKQLVDVYVPWIYYRLDKDEIDAWAQEIYIEASITNDVKTTKTYNKLIETIRQYNEIKEWYSSTDTYYTNQGAKQYIDRSIRRIDKPNNYFRVCDRNVAYLKGKLRRIIGRWNEEHGTPSSTFKQYASKEIPQSSPFIQRQKQNSLKNMFSKFFNRKKR